MKALVTGAARGLGLGLCAALTARGDTVFAACRKATPELRALRARVIEDVDIASPDAFDALRAGIGDETLDVLICNAGINLTFAYDSIEKLNLEDVEREYRVNAIGSVRTVQAVLPKLVRGSKIILVSTSGGTMRRNPVRTGSYGYRMSKSGTSAFAFLLSTELKPRGIAVRIISPGPVATDMLREITGSGKTTAQPLDQSPDALSVAKVMLPQIDELTLEESGSWIDQTGKLWA
jgi:NAD(P)-dependent dehydrogenase (short-subunit alcohol dehydrogenase family)